MLDLFSGTGSLGVESLSRGCGLVYFVDKSIKSIKLIEYNIKDLKGLDDKYKIIKSDVLKFLSGFDSFKWDIIFIDPPYRISKIIMKNIFSSLLNRKIVNSNTLIIYEYFFKRDVSEEFKNFKIIKESYFGDKKVIYLNPF